MLKILPLFVLCVACSPANDAIGDTAVPVMTNYATQIDAPSPDYRALLSQPSQAVAWRTERKATAPFPANAKSIGELWIARLKKRVALLGHGLAGKSPDGPVEMIDTGLTEKEFTNWANNNGWPVAAHIRWSFVDMGTFGGVTLYGLAGQLVCSEPSGSGVGQCELSANSVAIAKAKKSSRALIASS